MKREKHVILVVGSDGDAKYAICQRIEKDQHIILSCAADLLTETIEKLVYDHGRLDGIIFMAEVGDEKEFLELSFEDWRRVMDQNLDMAILCCQCAAEQMIHQGKREHPYSILLIVNTIDVFENSEKVAATAAAWALRGFMRHLALNLGPDNILVNLLAYEETETYENLASCAQFFFQNDTKNVTGITMMSSNGSTVI